MVRNFSVKVINKDFTKNILLELTECFRAAIGIETS